MNLVDWENDLDPGVGADAGNSTTRTYHLNAVNLQDAGKVFFRIER